VPSAKTSTMRPPFATGSRWSPRACCLRPIGGWLVPRATRVAVPGSKRKAIYLVGSERFRHGLGRGVEGGVQVGWIDLQQPLEGAEQSVLVGRKPALTRPRGQLGTRGKTRSAQDLLDVIGRGALTYHQLGGDLLIRVAACIP
jgi:hypothetical protein